MMCEYCGPVPATSIRSKEGTMAKNKDKKGKEKSKKKVKQEKKEKKDT